MLGRMRPLVLVTLALAGTARAQDKPQDATKPPEGTPTFPAQVEQVIVDVVVMDKKGSPVADLTRRTSPSPKTGRPRPSPASSGWS